MHRSRNRRGEALNSPLGWSMVPGAELVTADELYFIFERQGFADVSQQMTWAQFQTVVRRFFPGREKRQLCRRCEGAAVEGSGAPCYRCNGSGLERLESSHAPKC